MAYCTNCGKETDWVSKSGFCKECARNVLKVQKRNRPFFKKTWFIVTIAVFVCVCIIGAIVATSNDMDAGIVEPTHSPAATTATEIAQYVSEIQDLGTLPDDYTYEVVCDAGSTSITTSVFLDNTTEPMLKELAADAEYLASWDALISTWSTSSINTLEAIKSNSAVSIDTISIDLYDAIGSTLLLSVSNGELMFDILDGYESEIMDVLDGDIEPVSGNGSGDIVITTAVASESRLCKINFTHDGDGNFIIRDLAADGDLIVNEIGVWNGTYLFTPGSHSYEITADGNWTYSVDTIDKGARSGASGTRDGVSGWFDSVEASNVSFVHSGEGNFVVWLYCPDTEESELIVNEIGRYKGEKYVEFDPDIRYIWIVTADGSWSISIEQ